MTSERHQPLALCAFPGFPRGTGPLARLSSRGAHCSVSSPGARPLSRSGLRANQTRAMPRREMRVAGNQGQGPGYNGAIVGLQSVDFQAAVPHPPSLMLPIPAPCQEVTQTYCLLVGLRPKEAAFRIFPRDRGGRAAPCMVCYVHQVATEHHTSEGAKGGKGQTAQSLIRAWGDTALPVLSKKPS